jgi:hypothetical protein
MCANPEDSTTFAAMVDPLSAEAPLDEFWPNKSLVSHGDLSVRRLFSTSHCSGACTHERSV